MAICESIWYLAPPSSVCRRQIPDSIPPIAPRIRTNPPTDLGTTARHVSHSEHFIAFARPGNESPCDPWIEPRDEHFSIDPIVKD
jgi:hypothetical protein